MLALSLPPLRQGVPSDLGPLLEAAALTHLASYATSGISTRVTTSFIRAWGMTALQYWPRVTGGRPGFVMATWERDNYKKVVIAIEGTTDRSQLKSWLDGYDGMSNFVPCVGQLWSPVANHATATVTLLQADTTFNRMKSYASTAFTFTGFSLGASIASALGASFKRARPANSVTVEQFGGHNYGSAAFARGNFGAIRSRNHIYRNDPVYVVPGRAYGTVPLAGWQLFTAVGSALVNQSTPWFWDVRGRPSAIAPQGAGLTSTLAYARWFADTDEFVNWSHHTKENYRTLWANVANDRNDPNFWRYMFCEFPGDNVFGSRFRPGVPFNSAWIEEIAIPPVDEVIDSARVNGLFNAPPRVPSPASPTQLQEAADEWWFVNELQNTPTVPRRRPRVAS